MKHFFFQFLLFLHYVKKSILVYGESADWGSLQGRGQGVAPNLGLV